MTLKETLDKLEISKEVFYRVIKIIYPERKSNRGYNSYTEIDIDKIKKILAEENKKKEDDGNIKLALEKAGENEYYAKILKKNELFTVGVYSSTDLSIDILRFKNRGMDLKIIDVIEANYLFNELHNK